jgi:hypothetical protein
MTPIRDSAETLAKCEKDANSPATFDAIHRVVKAKGDRVEF